MPTANHGAILEIQGLRKRFGQREVLRGIDLSVRPAEVVVLIGPNGCGKSTLLRCLNLLETYQEGQVLLRGAVVSVGRDDNRPLNGAEQRQAQRLRQKVGMVFQQFNLFPHLNVLHNVMAGPRHVLKKPVAEARAIAEHMLHKVGLWEKKADDPLTLSGGQQQRVAIARTLAMNPDVVLFDEATSALDPVLTNEVFRVVRDLAFHDGMTMLLVTHDMNFARDIADRVVFLEQGRIGAQGTPADVFDQCPLESLREFLRRDRGERLPRQGQLHQHDQQ
ncbi:MAG: amino acid ABC transporter ATP-binding protein [Gemmataceae bacterium]